MNVSLTTGRRQRAKARRLQLLDTALPVFATKGLDGATGTVERLA